MWMFFISLIEVPRYRMVDNTLDILTDIKSLLFRAFFLCHDALESSINACIDDQER